MATLLVWACLLKLESKIVFACKFKSLRIPTLLKSLCSTTKRQVLVDSGATDNFISNRLLKRLKIGKLQLKNPRTVWNIDGTHNKSGTIRECVNLLVWVGDRRHEMRFLITDLVEDEIVLGYPWLAAFQLCIVTIQQIVAGLDLSRLGVEFSACSKVSFLCS